jgi:hypothetical protein
MDVSLRTRGVATLAALALLVANLGLLLHRLAVAHATCTEHGEIVHVEGGVLGAAPRPAARDGLRAAPGAAAHGHDHCALAFATRERVGLVPTAGVVAPCEPDPVAAAPAAMTHCVIRIDLWLLAPKTSPPVLV